MSRWFAPWSSSIKKRACRYLLQHYLGHFLQERLGLEQLSLDLYRGSGSIRDIHLDIWSVNEQLDAVNAPLEIVDGFIGSISVAIPWSALVTENCAVEISGLQVTCRPKYRGYVQGIESQSWSSCMTTSMQLAQECLKEQSEGPEEEPPQPLEGLEMFAQTIETVLRRIRVTFLDTIIRVEHTPDGCQNGLALEVHIKRLDYCDEAVKDSNQVFPVDIHQLPAFVHKVLQLSGVSLFYEQFPDKRPTPSSSPVPQEMEMSSCSASECPSVHIESPSQPEETPSPSQLLQIGSCSGHMEMTVKLKQNEAFPGPKLEVDGKMGSLHLLLSLKQMVYLQDLLSALCISEVHGLKEAINKSRPLHSEDLKLIEQDLSQQLYMGPDRNLTDDYELQMLSGLENGVEMFFSMAPMTSSVTSVRSLSDLSDVDPNTSIYSDNSTGQLQPSSLAPGIPRLPLSAPWRHSRPYFATAHPNLQNMKEGKASQPSPPLETLRPEMLLKITLGGLTLTVLHLCPFAGPSKLPSAELNQHFFTELTYFKDSAFSGRDFEHLRQRFQKACPLSHIRVTGAAVQVVCERNSGRSIQTLNTDLSFGMLEVLESLYTEGIPEPEYTELLLFKNRSAFTYSSSSKPCAQIHYKQTETVPSRSSRKKTTAKRSVEMSVELAEFYADVELGVVDRLGPIFHLPSAVDWERSFSAKTSTSLPLVDLPSATEHQSTLRVTSPKAHLRLQFPIPDLRPDVERRPWAEKAVRRECMRLDFTDAEFQTGFCSSAAASVATHINPTKLDFTFSDLHGVYEDGEKAAVPCIHVSKALDPLHKGAGKKYLFPKITVTFQPPHSTSPWDTMLEKSQEMELSSVESPCELKQLEPSPFSSKRTMYETEEMVIPGDPEEMAEFQAATVAMSQYTLEVTFPCAHIFLPSKEFYESIYNRINNDLLMWEPARPFSGNTVSFSGTVPVNTFFPGKLFGSTYQQENFQMCKSAFKLDSDSEDDDSHFYSVNEAKARKKAEQRCQQAQSFFCAVVNIGKGRLTALCEAKGENGKRLDGSHGEIVLDVHNGTIFSVSKHKGQEDLGYLCLESEKIVLYHKAVVEDYFLPEKLEIPSFCPPDKLDTTIYPSEEGVVSKQSAGRKDQSLKMLSAAIKINLDFQRNVKEFLVALRLDGATMRHHMALTNQSWYSQLLDFLDVIDDPVLGYLPPTVITVLHTHLFSCAVDYRPLYLPVRAVITAETFTLSSNIIVDTSTFLLRFILDDSAVYLSNRCDAAAVNLQKDYVCVLDVDLLELAITTWKGNPAGKLTQPLFELRCSNNLLHLHTCADSCAALVNLIQYVVNSGDLYPPPKQDSPTEIAGQKLQVPESPASLPPCLPAETAEINQGDLTDALMDTEKSFQRVSSMETDSAPLRQASPVSVYLFPGENSAPERVPSMPPPSPLPDEGSDACISDASEAESELTDNDDFCILDAPGMGIPPKDGEPVVTKLLEGPICVKDGHFSRPLGSTDLLKAPARFPVPETRIILQEISAVWHLYGGKDFGTSRPSSGHAQSPRMKSNLSNARSSPSRSSSINRPQNTWRSQGGSGRIHDVLMEIQLTKVSFQHETYTSASEKSAIERTLLESEELPVSRQVFIVQELEVRDRLAASQINKFLYLYTSEKMPRRAHSNMLSIKALHVCPEAGLGGPECCLRVSLMPLRLNIDQDALFFLKDFFTSLAAGINPVIPVETTTEARPDSSHRLSSMLDAEVSSKETETGLGPLTPGDDPMGSLETTISDNSSSSNVSSSSAEQPIYFREFRFTSEVPIWLDYHGKHVTMDQVGTFAGILIGLAQLNCSELKLKRLCCRHGLLGVDKVMSYALNEWLTDIRKNQLPGILGGVGPMHSVVQLFHGLRDLFWMPIEQYRKDGRIIRGLQRGAASFGTSTASAALELSNRLVQAIQATAETVYDILSPTSPVPRTVMDKKYARKLKKGQQPADLREGVAKAYDTVREGVIDTAQTLCDVAARGHERKGLTGAVGGVLRQIPPTVVKPLIVATEATSNLLGGMRNQIKPDARKEEYLKWRIEESQE